MADLETKRYMEMQMDELKDALDHDDAPAPKKNVDKDNEKNAELAKIYEDAYEYEEELENFQAELEIVNEHKLHNIAAALKRDLPDAERNYEQELHNILVATWTYRVETEKTHPVEELNVIKASDFNCVVETFKAAFPDYEGDFEADYKALLVTRLETLIAIKKDHIKEEHTEIKIMGLKPNFVKRIYKKYHGID